MDVPDSLLTCQAQPGAPIFAEDSELASYILEIVVAGEDCRSRLARVRELVQPPTK